MSVIFVNADWSAIVPAGSAEAAFGVQPKDAKRLGLDKLPGFDGEFPANAALAPEVLTSANEVPAAVAPDPEPVAPAPEPEVKEAPTPANKAARKPATKGAARKDPVDGDRN